MGSRTRRMPPRRAARARRAPGSTPDHDAGASNSEAIAALGEQASPGSATPLLDELTDGGAAPAPTLRYVVQAGDSLSAIAAAFDVPMEAIVAANGIADPDRIRTGQTLAIPSSSSSSGGASGAAGRVWVVQPGDSLWALSQRFGVSVDEIARANGIRDPDRIRAGQVLVLPGAGRAAPSSPSPSSSSSSPAPTSTAQAPQTTVPTPTAGPAPIGDTGEALMPAVNAVLTQVPADQRDYAETAVPRILEACLHRGVLLIDQVAYILATAQHESRFGKPLYSRSESLVEDHNPYTEGADGTWSAKVHTTGRTVTAGSEEELDLAYWDAAYGGKLDNRPGTADAANYRGRGYVQLTGRTNYERMSERLNDVGFTYTLDGQAWGGSGPPIDLLAHPDHVNRSPELAAEILVLGCGEGMFTGQALEDYIDASGTDFYGARAVVNGDKERVGYAIAEMAQRYAAALAPHWPPDDLRTQIRSDVIASGGRRSGPT